MSNLKLANENSIETDDNSSELYFVVKNHEDQYSIWPSYKKIPDGWESIGDPKVKEECLSFIEEVWVDMRPLSLRKQMEEINKGE